MGWRKRRRTTSRGRGDGGRWPYQTIPVLAEGMIYCRNTSGQLACYDVRR